MSKNAILKEILAGVTVGVIALPLSLAFGVASGLGAVAGLYGAIGLGLIAALFGGTRTQISGPTGPMTVVVATVVASYAESLEVVFAIFILTGIFQVIFGLLKLGRFIKYVPYPVISGFMSGVGLIIISQQIFPLLGHSSPSGTVNILKQLPAALFDINIASLLLGLLTVGMILIIPKLTKAIPSTLIALIVVTLIALFMNLTVPIIGEIPSGLPHLVLPGFHFSELSSMVVPALTLAALGSIDSLLTSLVSDKMTRERHNSNKELIGQGMGNVVAGLFGGLPGAGATMRTVANIQIGGRTRISGAVHALFLLFIVIALGSYASFIPMSVLAGILIIVGIGIIDYQGIKDFKIIPKHEVFITIIVCLLTLFVDLLFAVAVGIIISKIFLVVFLNHDINQYLKRNEAIHTSNENKSILVQKYRGPLFFGMANNFQAVMLEKIQTETAQIVKIIFDMTEVSFSDQSGLYGLVSVCKDSLDYSVESIYIIAPEHLIANLEIKIKEHKLEESVHLCESYEEAAQRSGLSALV